jgi:hypothetical protein
MPIHGHQTSLQSSARSKSDPLQFAGRNRAAAIVEINQ